MSQLKALILAAGMGTRMKSRRPKMLHEILGRSMVAYPVEAALEAGVDEVVVVVGHARSQVEAALRRSFPDAPLRFVVQAERRGTGHAVLCARRALERGSTEVLILNGDLPNLSAWTILHVMHETRASGSVLGVLTAELSDPSGYGRVVRSGDGRVLRVVEEADATETERRLVEVNVGTYFFQTPFLIAALETLDDANAQSELYLTDLVAQAAQAGSHACAVLAPDVEETLGINTRADLAEVTRLARRRRNQWLMMSGVTLIDPEATYIDWDVTIAPDVTIWPGAVIGGGGTIIERDAEIGPGVVIRDSHIGAGAQILAYSHLEGARIGHECRVGPYARLRPGAVLEPEVRIGNFVEVKQSVIGRGSKANHLTYIGDAEVGAGVNVGAGTITCNYDGKEKHRTIIGDGAFIGSNTELVAPVKVGRQAYVGAGSTITDDVPDGALGLGRARQVNLEGFGYAKRGKKP